MDFNQKLTYNKHISSRIAYFHTLNDISQEELAECIHLSRGALGKIERGIYGSKISLDPLLDIADALGPDLNMLISSDPEERQYWNKIMNTKTESLQLYLYYGGFGHVKKF